MATQTTIHSSWITHIDWANGLDTLSGMDQIKLPCIWCITPANITAYFGESMQAILSEAERQRGNRYHQQAHKERFETTHALLRVLLGKLLTLEPQNIPFRKGHHNKPLLDTDDSQAIHFNVSYTSNRALIAIDTEQPIGIDIERVNKAFDYQDMQAVCFSRHEIAFIDLNQPGDTLRFFTLWTRKEAILKLTGEGIGDHLPAFEVLDGDIEATKQSLGEAPPDHIHVHTFPIEQDYIGSIAMERPGAAINFYRL